MDVARGDLRQLASQGRIAPVGVLDLVSRQAGGDSGRRRSCRPASDRNCRQGPGGALAALRTLLRRCSDRRPGRGNSSGHFTSLAVTSTRPSRVTFSSEPSPPRPCRAKSHPDGQNRGNYQCGSQQARSGGILGKRLRGSCLLLLPRRKISLRQTLSIPADSFRSLLAPDFGVGPMRFEATQRDPAGKFEAEDGPLVGVRIEHLQRLQRRGNDGRVGQAEYAHFANHN